ncbi:MAG: hypothetical protein R2827_16655 [Bdellovibrionales bacterium]
MKFEKGNELLFYPVSSDRLGFKVYSDRLKSVVKEGTVKVVMCLNWVLWILKFG